MTANTLIHESVRLLLFNDKNELLLMRAFDPSTRDTDGQNHGAFWFTIGGQIEPDEDLYAAALRELWEETGLTQKEVSFGPIVWFGAFDLILSGKMTRLNQRFIVAHTTKVALAPQGLTAAEKKVIMGLSWLSLEEIKQLDEVVYPVDLPKFLPPILQREYPPKPIWMDLGKKPPRGGK